jgi:isopentenyl-diphosphate delta-isomerase
MWPLGLDMSMGGNVESGETYEEAFKRETQEELNIDIQTISYSLLGHLDPHTDHVSAFMNVYEINLDTAPDYNKDDFSEYYWLTPQEALDKLVQENPSKDDLPRLIKKFYV